MLVLNVFGSKTWLIVVVKMVIINHIHIQTHTLFASKQPHYMAQASGWMPTKSSSRIFIQLFGTFVTGTNINFYTQLLNYITNMLAISTV